jgi:replication factor C small subunit|tara:strand:+ start:26 stop:952 length:927 start_codon:yes stop_codon:yes gene_type:complete
MEQQHRAALRSIDDLVGASALKGDIVRWQKDVTKLPQAILLHGPSGTGKTSTGVLLAKMLLGLEFFDTSFIETNASDDRGISYIRDELKQLMRVKPVGTKKKVILLDEADGLTPAAQDAMRRLIEKYSEHTLLILTCNDLEKIRPAIRSRCAVYGFSPVDPIKGAQRLSDVYTYDAPTLIRLVQMMNGDMRACINFLDAAGDAYTSRIDDLESTMDDSVARAIEGDWMKLRSNLHNSLRSGLELTHVLSNFYDNIYEHFEEEENLDSIWNMMVAYGDVMTHKHTWVGNNYSYLDYMVAKMKTEVEKNE